MVDEASATRAHSSRSRTGGDKDALISICVATRRRPDSLAALLAALENLDAVPGFDVQWIVIDNDPDGSAREVYASFCDRSAHRIRYARESREGIPFARNAALRIALPESAYVAFIDDDSIPDPGWLAELLRVQREHAADVVTGPSPPHFLETPPAWIVEAGFFQPPRCPTGTVRPVAFTGNALVRGSVFAALDHPFDESMALSGGEDSELFTRVEAAGFRIVWADAALVHESIPPSRARLRWILMRGFSVGTSSARLSMRVGNRNRAGVWVHGSYCVAKGLMIAILAIIGLLIPGLPWAGRGRAAIGLRLAFYGVGRLAGGSGYLHPEYQSVEWD